MIEYLYTLEIIIIINIVTLVTLQIYLKNFVL